MAIRSTSRATHPARLPMPAEEYFAGPSTDPGWGSDLEGAVLVATNVSFAQYGASPESSVQHNLIGGDLYRMAGAGTDHQRIARKLLIALDAAATTTGGEALQPPYDCQLTDEIVMQPDCLYVSPERLNIIGPMRINGAPDIVVEVLSASTRRFNERVKLPQYARAGVREAWIVDPDRQAVTVYFGNGSEFTRTETVSFGEVIPSEMVEVGTAGLAPA